MGIWLPKLVFGSLHLLCFHVFIVFILVCGPGSNSFILQGLVANSAVHAMPPKEKAVSESGSVALNGNGALARLQVAGRKVNGPQRGTRAEAQADLDQARQCASREEMATLLEQLRAGAVNVAVSHNDLGVQPAEPHRKRQRTKGTPSTVESQSAALNPVASSSGLCQNKEDATLRKAAVVPGMSQRDQELVRTSHGDQDGKRCWGKLFRSSLEFLIPLGCQAYEFILGPALLPIINISMRRQLQFGRQHPPHLAYQKQHAQPGCV